MSTSRNELTSAHSTLVSLTFLTTSTPDIVTTSVIHLPSHHLLLSSPSHYSVHILVPTRPRPIPTRLYHHQQPSFQPPIASESHLSKFFSNFCPPFTDPPLPVGYAKSHSSQYRSSLEPIFSRTHLCPAPLRFHRAKIQSFQASFNVLAPTF